MVSGGVEIKQLVGGNNLLGEVSLWDVAEQWLYWIDSWGKKIFCAAPDGSELETWGVPEMIGSLALRRSGAAVSALKNGFHFFDFNSGACKFILDPEPEMADTRLNDGSGDYHAELVIPQTPGGHIRGLGYRA